MNWGYKILIVIVLFIVSMLAMVFVSFRQTNDMVDTNYYEKELKYQSLIDASKNLNDVSSIDLISPKDGGIAVTIPPSLLVDFKNGQLEFLKNDDQKQDFTLNFEPIADGVYLIPNAKLQTGSYKVRIQWESNKKSYYREQTVIVP
jgi:hypothetical protein